MHFYEIVALCQYSRPIVPDSKPRRSLQYHDIQQVSLSATTVRQKTNAFLLIFLSHISTLVFTRFALQYMQCVIAYYFTWTASHIKPSM